MSNQEINELNDLQVLDYDIFGKCNDMMSFIKSTQYIQKEDPQIKVKIGAVGKLINFLLKFLKESDSSSLSAQPEYQDIVYIINNNLSQRIKQYEDKIKQMNANDQQSKNEINQLRQEIQKWKEDQKQKINQIDQLSQEKAALTHQLQLLDEQNFEQIDKQQNEYENLNQLYSESTNEVTKLQLELKLKDEKIQNYEGKINQQQQQIQKLQSDQSQDRKDPLFYDQQQIFKDNEELKKERIQQHSILNPLTQKNNKEEVNENLQQENVQDEQLNQEIKEIQSKIFYYLNQLSMFGFFLSACVGAYVMIQYYK